MTRSALVYRERRKGTCASPCAVVALHDWGAGAESLVPFVAAAFPDASAWFPEAARPRNSLLCGGDALAGYGGFTWFLPAEDGGPEPATFGDSLVQVDRFLADVGDRVPPGTPRVLVGVGQGATLAIAAASLAPGVADALVLLDGVFPRVPGWRMRPRALEGIETLVVAGGPCTGVTPLEAALARAGAVWTCRSVPGVRAEPHRAAAATRVWMDERVRLNKPAAQRVEVSIAGLA